MKHRPGATLFALALLFVCLAPQAVRACVCMRSKPCESAARASAIFIGTATREEFEERPVNLGADGVTQLRLTVTYVRVEEVFHGAVEGELKFVEHGTTCDYVFKPGERYLIFAGTYPDGKTFDASTCSGTTTLADASEELAYLRSAAGRVRGGSVVGEVTREVWPGRGRDGEAAGSGGVRVILEHEGQSFTVTTDASGRYALTGLPAGRYKIRTDPPANDSNARFFYENYERVGPAAEGEKEQLARPPDGPRAEWLLEVPARGCVEVRFSERAEGEIAGEVTGLRDVPPGEVSVQLLRADGGDPGTFMREATLDSERRFKFTYVPAGRYYLGFNIRGGPSLSSPYAELYYPGARTRAEAQALNLEPGQKLRGLSLEMAPRVRKAFVEGVAVWPDGRAAAGVWVELTNPRTGYDEENGAETDAQGRFRLKGIEGQTYDLSALINKGRPLVNSRPLRVTLRAGGGPVRLVIKPPEEKERRDE